MQPIQSWEKLDDDKKAWVKKIGIASIVLYVLLQLISFLFPIVLTLGVGYWAYKNFIDKEQNPRVLR